MTARIERLISLTWLFLPALVAWTFIPQIANAFLIKHHIATVAVLCVALLFFLTRKSFAVPGGLVGSAFLLWLVAMLGSAAVAANSHLAMTQLVEMTAMVLLVFCLFNPGNPDVAQRNIENGILIASAGVALFALKQYFLPHMLDPDFHALGKMRIYSTLGNPSLAALVILAAVPSAASRVMRGSSPSRRLHALLVIILLAGLLVTQSRNMLGAVGVMATIALLWLGTAQVRRVLFIVFLLCLAGLLLFLLFAQMPPEVEHAFRGRWFIWQTALAMMLDHPLAGVGLGHFGLAHLDYQASLYATGQFDSYFNNAAVIIEGHNELLQWGAVTGVFGLLGFTVLCAGILWLGWRSPSLRARAPQLYLALTGYVFAMMFISVTAYPGTIFFFWLLLGSVMARSELPRIEWTSKPWARYASAALMLLALSGAGNWAWQDVQSGWHEARGDAFMAEHDLWLAQREYQQAVVLNPYGGELSKKFATTLFLDQRLDEALIEIEAAKRNSGDLGILLLEGEIRTRAGELHQAAAIYRKIIAAFPNMVGAHFILGQIYLLQGKGELSDTEFHRVLDIQPSPYNLNLTSDKIEQQKRIVRDYLRNRTELMPRSQIQPG